VIPAYNEAAAVELTVAAARAALQRSGLTDFEVLVVDDGSSDGTGQRAAAAGATVVVHPHNAGYGRSVKDGISAARHDTIVIADSDGTYPLDRIADLLAEYRRGFNMVVGHRPAGHLQDSAVKRPLRRVLQLLVEFTVGRKIPDVNSGLRVFSRAEVLPYYHHLCDTFSFTTSLTLAYLMTGRFVAWVPIAYGARIGSTKVRLFRESLRTLQYIVQAIVYYNPIKIFLLMSGLCAAFGLTSLLAAFALHLTVGYLVGAGALLIAVLVFALGLLADLLRQIMAK
jgi:glycosyltransferase involved in cell wall biosynthesis